MPTVRVQVETSGDWSPRSDTTMYTHQPPSHRWAVPSTRVSPGRISSAQPATSISNQSLALSASHSLDEIG